MAGRMVIFLMLMGIFVAACGGKNRNSRNNDSRISPNSTLADGCPPAVANECLSLQQQIIEARKNREAALEAKNAAEASRRNLEMDYDFRFIDLYTRGHKDSEEHKILTQEKEQALSLFNWAETELPTCSGAASSICTKLTEEIRGLNKDLQVLGSDTASPRSVQLHVEKRYRELRLQQLANGSHDANSHILAQAYKTALASMAEVRTFLTDPNDLENPARATCRPSLAKVCESLESEIAVLRAERERALNSSTGREAAASALTLELNHKLDLLDAHRQGYEPSSPEVQSVNSKHDALRKLFDKAAPGSGSLFSRVKPYSLAEQQAVKEVMSTFGELYIQASARDANGQAIPSSVEAAGGMPWAGYWYPMRSTELFATRESPLVKFDQLLAVSGFQAEAASWEQNRYDPQGADWAGHCDAWAVASMLTKEPKQDLVYKGIRFKVSDLKALLVKKYEGYEQIIFGRRYTGNEETDGEHQDLRPEAFHRIVEVEIGEKHRAIGIDSDPGPEVWNKPLYKMRWAISPDSERKDAFVVEAWPHLVKHRTLLSEQTTSNFDDLDVPAYKYRLYVDLNDTRDGKYRVIFGEWLENSLNKHPDMVFVTKDDAAIKPKNPGIANHLDILDALFTQGVPAT